MIPLLVRKLENQNHFRRDFYVTTLVEMRDFKISASSSKLNDSRSRKIDNPMSFGSHSVRI